MDEQATLPRPPLDRGALDKCVVECLHPARSAGQADIHVLGGAAAGWLLKDFSRRPLWIRLLITRRALRREARALRALQGVPGIPKLAGMAGPDAMVLDRLDATRLPHRRDNFLTPEFFDRLEAMVRAMHTRGWAHGDLRRKNILVDRALNPYLIDFATAWHAPPGSRGPRRFLFKRWKQVDLLTMTRIKRSYFPDALTAEDLEILRKQPFHIQLGRFLRKRLYRPLKKRNRRKAWRKLRQRFRRTDASHLPSPEAKTNVPQEPLHLPRGKRPRES